MKPFECGMLIEQPFIATYTNKAGMGLWLGKRMQDCNPFLILFIILCPLSIVYCPLLVQCNLSIMFSISLLWVIHVLVNDVIELWEAWGLFLHHICPLIFYRDLSNNLIDEIEEYTFNATKLRKLYVHTVVPIPCNHYPAFIVIGFYRTIFCPHFQLTCLTQTQTRDWIYCESC